MLLPDTVYLGMDVQVGPDTVLYPGVILEGSTRVGASCVLGPNTHIVDSTVGDECRIVASMIEQSTIERGVDVGPYSHVRPGTHLAEGVHLGNFVEVKASTLGPGVHSGHFSYLGDATIGEGTNIGAGTVTANFDSATRRKNKTVIGKNAFIGVDTMIVAPREIGDGAATGAGSVVTKDVPPRTLVVGVPAKPLREVEPYSGPDHASSEGTNEET
jgi:bifunctional UDP-N-acetylglucosamine pyrophosphorylase/glucosamine-1-phosphate N-acetyltransferase